jgi:8-oxo-dGTP diphosphatase
MPAQFATLTVTRPFTAAEMDRIRTGLIPREMEDRWFMFFEDNTLFVHRSWTGFCIYAAAFKREGDVYLVDRLRVNRDDTQYSANDDAADVRQFLKLVTAFLLDSAPFGE